MLLAFVTVALAFLLSGVLAIHMGLKSRSHLPRNPWMGVRTRKTMRDEETFAQANRAIWRIYVAVGAISIIAGIAVLIIGLIDDEAYPALGVIGIATSVITLSLMIYGSVKAHRSIK